MPQGPMLVLELCGLPSDWPIGLGTECTRPHAGGPLGATTACPNSTHLTEAVLMLQAGAEACGADGGAFLVCFLQVLASGILLSHPYPKIERFFHVAHQLPNDASLEKNPAPWST